MTSLPFFTCRSLLLLFMLLLGVSNGFTQTLLGALWPEVYGLANLGGIRAIIVSGMVLSTALGPGITGEFIDLGVPLPIINGGSGQPSGRRY